MTNSTLLEYISEGCFIEEDIKNTLASVRFDFERRAFGAFWYASSWTPETSPFDPVEHERWQRDEEVKEEEQERLWLEEKKKSRRLWLEEEKKSREEHEEAVRKQEAHRLQNAWRRLIRTKLMVSLHDTFQGVVSYMTRYIDSSKHSDSITPQKSYRQLFPKFLHMGFWPEEVRPIKLTDKRYEAMVAAAAQHAKSDGYKLTVVDPKTWRLQIEGPDGSIQEGFFRALVVVPVAKKGVPKDEEN